MISTVQISRQGDHRGGAEPGADGAAGGVGDGQAQPQDGQEDAEPGEPQQVGGRCSWAGSGYSCRLLDQGLVV